MRHSNPVGHSTPKSVARRRGALARAAGAVALFSMAAFASPARAIMEANTDVWAGINGLWDTTSPNWTVNGVTSRTYSSGDFVYFDNVQPTSQYTVSFVGTLTPSSVVVDNDSTAGLAAFAAEGGNYLFEGSGSIGSANGASLTKTGGGKLTIADTVFNTYTGATSLFDGSVYISAPASQSIISSSSPLYMSGAYLGLGSSIASQSFNGTTLGVGDSTFFVDTNPGAQLNLGSISLLPGATANFQIPGAGTITTSNPTLNELLGPWATVNSDDWASETGDSITSLANTGGYVNNTWAAGNNTTETTINTVPSGSTTNSLKFGVNGVTTVLTGGLNTIQSGGILVSGVLNGASNFLQGPGQLTSGTNGLIVIENDAAGALNIGAQLVGSMSFTKSGPGTAMLDNPNNSYTGPTYINNGTLCVNSLGAGGTASGIGMSGNSAGNLVFNGGTLLFLGTGSAPTTTDHLFTLGPQGGGINASGLGPLDFTNTGEVPFLDSVPSAVTFTLTGDANYPNSFAPWLENPGSGQNVLNLIKSGTGQWNIISANGYSGGTSINGGVLNADNASGSALGTGPVSVNATGSLGGLGFIAAPVTINSGGTLAPGDAANLTINSSLTLQPGATLGYNFNIANTLGPAGGNDLTTVNGNVTLNQNITASITPGASFGNGSYTFIHYNTATDDSSSFTGWNAGLTSVPVNLAAGHYYVMGFQNDTVHDNVNLLVTTSATTPNLGTGQSGALVQPANTPIDNSAPNNPVISVVGGAGGNGGPGGNSVPGYAGGAGPTLFYNARGTQAAAKVFSFGWIPVVAQIAPQTPYYNVGVNSATVPVADAQTGPGWAYAGQIPTILNPPAAPVGLADTGVPYANPGLNANPLAPIIAPGNGAGAPGTAGGPPAAYANAQQGAIAGNVWLPAFCLAPVIVVTDPPATPTPTYYGESFTNPNGDLGIHLADQLGGEDMLATSMDTLTGTDPFGEPYGDLDPNESDGEYQGSFLSLVQSDYPSITELSQLDTQQWDEFDGSYGLDPLNAIAWAVDDVPDADYTVVAVGPPVVLPEPATLALLGLGGMGLLARRRRRQG